MTQKILKPIKWLAGCLFSRRRKASKEKILHIKPKVSI